MAKARFDEDRNSLTIWVRIIGRPWPPNSVGAEMPIQPPSTSCLNASPKPFGVVTRQSAVLALTRPCRRRPAQADPPIRACRGIPIAPAGIKRRYGPSSKWVGDGPQWPEIRQAGQRVNRLFTVFRHLPLTRAGLSRA